MLHSILPLAAPAVLADRAVPALVREAGPATGGALAPHLFLGLLVAAMAACAGAESSFREGEGEGEGGSSGSGSGSGSHSGSHSGSGHRPLSTAPPPTGPPRAIAPADGTVLSLVLVLVPPLMHLASHRGRIGSPLAGWDDVPGLILALTVPYALHCRLIAGAGHRGVVWWGPALPRPLGRPGRLASAAATAAAAAALLLNCVLPVCSSVAYSLHGHGAPSPTLTALWLAISAGTAAAAGGLWNLLGPDGRSPLLGELHEDALQLLLSASGLGLGMACGLPWNLLPVPVLALLAGTLYVTTLEIRYFAMVLLLTGALGTYFVQYRYLYLDRTVGTLLGREVPVYRLGQIALLSGLLLLTSAGLVYRSPGGWAGEYVRDLDLAGIMLGLYATLLVPVEATLLHSFAGSQMEGQGWDGDEYSGTYRPYMALLSGGVLIAVSWHLLRTRCIKPISAIVTSSMSLGKVFALLSGAPASDGDEEADGPSPIADLVLGSFAASMLLMVLFLPTSVLTPPAHHSKRSAAKKRALGPSGKPAGTSPSPGRTNATLLGYCGLVLPATILLCIPSVLTPLSAAMRARNAYYKSSPPITQILGFATSLWGVASLSVANHLLPEGGSDAWRKASALAFFLGLGLYLTAPAVPWASDRGSPSIAFASVSSLGAEMGESSSGGWGLVSAALATLLALIGPLELRERRDRSGKRDQTHVLRLMVFSILFGCGIAWFVVIQSMSGEPFLSLFVTAFTCVTIAFLGTVTCVLGYCVESQNYDEVQQMAKIWLGTLLVLFLVSGSPTMLSNEGSAAFGLGGWLSTYLSVSSLVSLAFTAASRCRREKIPASLALGNFFCILSWAFAVISLYGQFGLASIGVSNGSFFGVPVSVIGTFSLAPILSFLEGETSESNRRRVAVSTSGKKIRRLGISFQSLAKANKFINPLAGTVLVFLSASLYAIFLRGCGWFVSGDFNQNNDGFANVKEFLDKAIRNKHEDPMKNILGSKVIISAAKLAGTGFWTSKSIIGPVLHLAGVVALVPSLYMLIMYSWAGTPFSLRNVLVFLPLNLFALAFCRGIPSLWAASLVGIIGGGSQALSIRQNTYTSHMRM